MRMQSDRPRKRSGEESADKERVTGDNNLGNLSMQMLIKAIFSVLLGFGLFRFYAGAPKVDRAPTSTPTPMLADILYYMYI